MDIATFNVNGIRSRLDAFFRWTDQRDPDVICLQETKVVDEQFPRERFDEAGYHIAFAGQKSYNGVAILSKTPIENVRVGIEGFEDPQVRVIRATVGGVKIINVYVPNGTAVGHEKFAYKMRWLDAFHADLATHYSPDDPIVMLGDFNIAAEDRDVYDVEDWGPDTPCSPEERLHYKRLIDWGFVDTFRQHSDAEDQFSWWDYRGGRFWRGEGLRIDYVVATQTLAEQCTACRIDIETRRRKKASDHAPVVATFSLN
jgi:exodeoxyribonuclease-3